MKNYTDDFRRDAVRYVDEHPAVPVKEVAKYLGIPKYTLYGWTKTVCRNNSLERTILFRVQRRKSSKRMTTSGES